MRKLALVAALVLATVSIAIPASATKPDSGSDLVSGHKIWICHATRSLSNPYVKILIDIAAWDIADPDSNDHGPKHHERTKQGVTWGDYALNKPTDDCKIPTTGLQCPDRVGHLVDYVIYFDGTKLRTGEVSQTVDAAVAAGTYAITLGSSDLRPKTQNQDNEQWRAIFGGVATTFSADLDDTGLIASNSTNVGTRTIPAVKTVTAQHWSVAMTSYSADSVIPVYACLDRQEGGLAG